MSWKTGTPVVTAPIMEELNAQGIQGAVFVETTVYQIPFDHLLYCAFYAPYRTTGLWIVDPRAGVSKWKPTAEDAVMAWMDAQFASYAYLRKLVVRPASQGVESVAWSIKDEEGRETVPAIVDPSHIAPILGQQPDLNIMAAMRPKPLKLSAVKMFQMMDTAITTGARTWCAVIDGITSVATFYTTPTGPGSLPDVLDGTSEMASDQYYKVVL